MNNKQIDVSNFLMISSRAHLEKALWISSENSDLAFKGQYIRSIMVLISALMSLEQSMKLMLKLHNKSFKKEHDLHSLYNVLCKDVVSFENSILGQIKEDLNFNRTKPKLPGFTKKEIRKIIRKNKDLHKSINYFGVISADKFSQISTNEEDVESLTTLAIALCNLNIKKAKEVNIGERDRMLLVPDPKKRQKIYEKIMDGKHPPFIDSSGVFSPSAMYIKKMMMSELYEKKELSNLVDRVGNMMDRLHRIVNKLKSNGK